MIDRSWIPQRTESHDEAPALREIDRVIEAGPYSPSWESLKGYRPARWFGESKFGIFIHWGVYSVPAFADEWYSRNMYRQDRPEFAHHRERYGDQAAFGYKDFIPDFTMNAFDPVAWATLFRRAGAQYVVPVAEHHDGFAMYASERSRWTVSHMGPKRDVFGELAAAVREQSLVVGGSSHRAEHWFFMNGGMRFDSDVRDPAYSDFYGPAQREETSPSDAYLDDWLLRTVEFIDLHRPQLLWFDWWIETPAFEPYLRRLAAYYYNRAAEWGIEVVINYKWDAFATGSAVYDIERGAMGEAQPFVWQNDTAVSRSSWCWTEGHCYKPIPELIGELLDVVSKNGNLLLNIGPKPDGTIAAPEVAILESIGDWLAVNGEAVYGTVPYRVPGEGPTQVKAGSMIDGEQSSLTADDFRFTVRNDFTGSYLYASTTGWPASNSVTLTTLGLRHQVETRAIAEVRLLGLETPLEWRREADGLHVSLPSIRTHEHGYSIRISFYPDEAPRRVDFLHQN